MENQKANQSLQVTIGADKSVIPAGKPGTRILEINLKAKGSLSEKPRIPLSLALVIDRSGSMGGDKLHFVKKAAAHVIDLLSEQDRVAIIIYDNEVETLMKLQYLSDAVKREAKAKIASIQTRGSTFLYGGWLAGCREIAEAIDNQSFNRTLLLTDGLANVGERDANTISMHAQELFTRHISTSCFGVGQDYDEHMLELIANRGGGNFHFLETTNAILLVFEREFDEIISIALKDVRVELTLPAGVEATVSAGWNAERKDDRLVIFLGSLVADQTQPLYLQLSKLAGGEDGHLSIPVRVTGMDADQVEHQFESALSFKVVSEAEALAAEEDADLKGRFAVVDLADKANEALKMERAGDRVGSSQILKNYLNKNNQILDDETIKKYSLMSDQMSIGYDSIDRKRRHFQEYQSKRGWQSIRDYRLDFSSGLPIARIEDRFVLINTGAPVSIAKEDEWLFLNQAIQFQAQFNGLTCEQLSLAMGIQVDVMLGMDVLADLHLRMNPAQELVQFSRQPFHSSGVRVPVDKGKLVPSIPLTLNGKTVDMRLVTGLKLNYIPASLVASLNPFGTAKDRLPGGNEFETALYKLPTTLGRYPMSLTCGVLPDAQRQLLLLGEGEGVLGADFLQTAPLTLAFPENELVVYL